MSSPDDEVHGMEINKEETIEKGGAGRESSMTSKWKEKDLAWVRGEGKAVGKKERKQAAKGLEVLYWKRWGKRKQEHHYGG